MTAVPQRVNEHTVMKVNVKNDYSFDTVSEVRYRPSVSRHECR